MAGLGAAIIACVGARSLRAVHAPSPIAIGSRVDVADAPVPGVWIFARPDCSHCTAHLQRLAHVLATCPDSLRPRLIRHIAVVGDVAPPCDGVRVLPDSVRRAFRLQVTPETWFVDADGRIRIRWRGARGAHAWRNALAEIGSVP